MLLVGFAGPGHAGALLADALIVATINRQILTLLSVPRDLLVVAPSGRGENVDFVKLNAVLARARLQFGWSQALTALESAVNVVTGVRVDGSIATDFDGFRRFLEGMGGVDVDIPHSFVARYPTDHGGWTDVRFRSGTVHLDALQALVFVRARHTSLPGLGDFVRARHQRALLQALARRRDIGALFSAVLRSRREVHATVSLVAMLRFLIAVQTRQRVQELNLSDCTELLSVNDPALGAFLVPRHGSYAAVRRAVRHNLCQDCSDIPVG